MVTSDSIMEIMAIKNVNIDKYDQPILDMAIGEAETQIRTYCGFDLLDEMPNGLRYVWADMALDVLSLYVAEESNEGVTGGGGGATTTGVVKSIKEGDISVEFVTNPAAIVAASTANAVEATDKMKRRYETLNLYRKIYGLRA